MNCNCPRSSYGIKHTPECYDALAADKADLLRVLGVADGRIAALEAELAMQKEILARYHKLNLAAPETKGDAT